MFGKKEEAILLSAPPWGKNKREKGCTFCRVGEKEKLGETKWFHILPPKYPYSAKHAMLIPKKHVEELTQLADEELDELKKIAKILNGKGYILLANQREIASQHIPHLHLHILPNYDIGKQGGHIKATWKGLELRDITSIAIIKNIPKDDYEIVDNGIEWSLEELEKIRSIIDGLEKSFEEIKKRLGGWKRINEGLKLAERIGYNVAIAEEKVFLVPRAGKFGKDGKIKYGLLEVICNIKLVRELEKENIQALENSSKKFTSHISHILESSL